MSGLTGLLRRENPALYHWEQTSGGKFHIDAERYFYLPLTRITIRPKPADILLGLDSDTELVLNQTGGRPSATVYTGCDWVLADSVDTLNGYFFKGDYAVGFSTHIETRSGAGINCELPKLYEFKVEAGNLMVPHSSPIPVIWHKISSYYNRTLVNLIRQSDLPQEVKDSVRELLN